MINFQKYSFHPVVHLPDEYEIRDFSTRENPHRRATLPFSIGRYDEDRVNMYDQEIFEGRRTVHMGIDIGAPIGTLVHSFWEGWIYACGYNREPGDYGHVIVTEHRLDGLSLWALYGHLSEPSIAGKLNGQKICHGEVLGTIGRETENGGWPPHLHFQLSYTRPATHDLPGVVAPADRAQALLDYPDPRLVLGPLY
jgi:murein DD-endopeptidase MepM/ murein hydrolase activator NlpD